MIIIFFPFQERHVYKQKIDHDERDNIELRFTFPKEHTLFTNNFVLLLMSVIIEMCVMAFKKVCIYLQDRRTQSGLSVAIDAFNKAAGR